MEKLTNNTYPYVSISYPFSIFRLVSSSYGVKGAENRDCIYLLKLYVVNDNNVDDENGNTKRKNSK